MHPFQRTCSQFFKEISPQSYKLAAFSASHDPNNPNHSPLSHGIGTDNIDIVVNELDALANIDLKTRTDKPNHTSLTMVRIGTCGGLQEDLPVGTFLASRRSIGFDGVLNFYKDRDKICDLNFEQAFVLATGYSPTWARRYVVYSDKELLQRIAQTDMAQGVTISANGF